MDEEGSHCTLVPVVLTPGDEVAPQLADGHLVLGDIPEEVPPYSQAGDAVSNEQEANQTLTRIVQQTTTSGPGSVHQTVIQLHSPDMPASSPSSGNKAADLEHSMYTPDGSSQFTGDSMDERRAVLNDERKDSVGHDMRRPPKLISSPSDPAVYGRRTSNNNIDRLSARKLQQKTQSLCFIDSGLSDNEKTQALRNLHRRSTQPEVFIFPTGPQDTGIPSESTIANHKKFTAGHVNTG